MALHALLAQLNEDLAAARRRDPAARNRLEVALTYPGVHAVWGYRVANAAWRRGHKLSARLISAAVRTATGVDIHPAAQLGPRLFIDHANGVVIGETTQLGSDCVLFHQVTLGGVSMSRDKRHPTLGNRVMVGAGAKVLGPVTVGDDAKIGANAVVVGDVPPESVAIGIPAKIRHPATSTADRDLIVDPTLYI